MKKIAVVYWSGTGNTEAMARLVAEGAQGEGISVDLLAPLEFSAVKAREYDSIALGCPSMGDEELEETEFAPMYQDVKAALSHKTVGLFGSYGWGDGQWMRDWASDCQETGCRLAADPVLAHEAPAGEEAEACKALGAALAAS